MIGIEVQEMAGRVPKAISKHMAEIGSKGGKKRGEYTKRTTTKAERSKRARELVNLRWAKEREAGRIDQKPLRPMSTRKPRNS